MRQITTGIIGCGNMGGAIARGMVKKNITSGRVIFLYDKEIEKATFLAKETGCLQKELSLLVRDSDLLVIAVKPQDCGELLNDIAGDITKQTIISVMAGVRIKNITDKLGKDVPVARVMPNMCASIGESVTCISYSGEFGRKKEVKDIFESIGSVVDEVEESVLDAVTAVSGSGPAYLFFLAEAMMSACGDAGLDGATARELVVQTLYGAALLIRNTESSPEELIEKVASKGGTTEAALSVLEEKGVKAAIKAAIMKAKQRAEELSRR